MELPQTVQAMSNFEVVWWGFSSVLGVLILAIGWWVRRMTQRIDDTRDTVADLREHRVTRQELREEITALTDRIDSRLGRIEDMLTSIAGGR